MLKRLIGVCRTGVEVCSALSLSTALLGKSLFQLPFLSMLDELTPS